MSNQLYSVIDYETYSEADLKKVGIFEYVNHPSTEILCVAWAVGTFEQLKKGKYKVEVYAPWLKNQKRQRKKFIKMLLDKNVQNVAHNAAFEMAVTHYVLTRGKLKPGKKIKMAGYKKALKELKPEDWLCSAAMARAVSLPGKLEDLAKALRLDHEKDMKGHRLMLKMCKPRKPSKNNPSTRHTDIDEYKRVVKYCVSDIDAEVSAFVKTPMLSPSEKRIWNWHQRMNWHGVKIDHDLVDKVLDLVKEEQVTVNKKVNKLTNGEIETTGQRDKILEFLNDNGCPLDKLNADAVDDAIKKKKGNKKAQRLLKYRKQLSKTSTAKYIALKERSKHDGFLRDFLLYHVAHTGRDGGRGVQLQNLPRGDIKDFKQALEIVKDFDLETIRILLGSPLETFSGLVRPCLRARKGKVLNIADYNAVEARGLFWLADHQEGIEAFNRGVDNYKDLATAIYNTTLDKIDALMRFVGKQGFLGNGYGQGAAGFIQTCLKYGVEIEKKIANKAVKAYRTKHEPVVKLWGNLERAAIMAVQSRGKRIKVNKVTWYTEGIFLFCELPSGRKIAYVEPKIEMVKTPWGANKAQLTYMGVDSTTRKWKQEKTYGGKITENVVQALCRDLLFYSISEAEKEGYKVLFHVHDELVTEVDEDKSDYKKLEEIMGRLPKWAKGLPMKVEGFESPFFRKD